MTINTTHIKDCIYTIPNLFTDNRGIFSEIFKSSKLTGFIPKQLNYSYSHFGVFRGIHRTPYAKLVTCVSGAVYDICVDLREESLTYGEYFGLELNSDKLNSLYIPPYCGHGFLALKNSVLVYAQEDEYMPDKDEAHCYKNFGIQLPFDPKIISQKDISQC